MPTVGQDLFTESSDTFLSSHTPDVGAGWTVEGTNPFTVDAAGDYVYHTSTARRMARKGDDIGDDDMDVSMLVNSDIPGTGTREVGVCGRMTTADFDNAYQAFLETTGAAAITVYLYKEESGSRTELGSWSPGSVNMTLKLEIRTAAKKIYVDGVERISSADDSLTGNPYAGIIMKGHSNQAVRGDNFLSESVAAAVNPKGPLGMPIQGPLQRVVGP